MMAETITKTPMTAGKDGDDHYKHGYNRKMLSSAIVRREEPPREKVEAAAMVVAGK